MEKEEVLWRIYERNTNLTSLSDTKAGLILSIYGIIFTIIFTNVSDLFNCICSHSLLITSSILTGISSLLAIYFSFRCINPHLKNTKLNSNIYFSSIERNNKSYKEYQKMIEKSNFYEDIVEQVYTTSLITSRKFKRVTWAIRFFTLSLCLLLFDVVFYLLNI